MKTSMIIALLLIALSVVATGIVQAAVEWKISDGGNGHSYETFAVPGRITWSDASNMAQSMGGYLATITSEAENQFVFNVASNVDAAWFTIPEYNWKLGPWLGGYQDRNAPDYLEPTGGWRWINGEPFTYSPWAYNQPGDADNAEDHLQYAGWNMVKDSTWNDVYGGTPMWGYVVEFNHVPPMTVTVPNAWTYPGFWADTGIDLTTGMAIHVDATGTLWAGSPGSSLSCGPDGFADHQWFDQWLNPNNLGNGALDPAANGAPPVTNHYYALIGYVGPSPLTPSLYGNISYEQKIYFISKMMLLGSNVTAISPGSGRLWLGINTDAYAGNLSNDFGYITATVSIDVFGTITLKHWSGIIEGKVATIELRDGTGTTLETKLATLAANGGFSFDTNLADGSYTAVAKVGHWLAKAMPLTITGGSGVVNFQLTNGDCNGDNGVDEIDYAILSNAWYQGIGDPRYNPDADLLGDGGVDEIDYAILSNAWYTAGD